MSLISESFPEDVFINELQRSPHTPRFLFTKNHRQLKLHQNFPRQINSNLSSIASTSSASPTETQISSIDCDEYSLEHSGKDAVSDPEDVNRNSGFECSSSRNQRAVSYQDLHSAYTKRRYQHIESKVGKYIASMRAEDKQRRDRKFQRHSSLPLNLFATDSGSPNCLSNMLDSEKTDELLNTSKTYVETCEPEKKIAQLLNEKEKLQTLNEYLQSNLNEKMVETSRLRRNVDIMRIELTNAKDQIKQAKLETTKNSRQYPYIFTTRPKMSSATQTDLLPLKYFNSFTDQNNNKVDKSGFEELESNIATIQDNSLNFSTSGSSSKYMRRRSNSNPMKSSNFLNNVSQSDSNHNISIDEYRSKSSDSAIQIELAKTSPEKKQRSLFSSYSNQTRKELSIETFYGRMHVTSNENEYNTMSENVNAIEAAGTAKTDNLSKESKQRPFKLRWKKVLGACMICNDKKLFKANNYTQLEHFNASPPLSKDTREYRKRTQQSYH